MNLKKLNLIELNAQEAKNIEGGNAFIEWCCETYHTICNWATVL